MFRWKPIFAVARKHKQVAEESIQLQALAHQRVQAVEALAHIARLQVRVRTRGWHPRARSCQRPGSQPHAKWLVLASC